MSFLLLKSPLHLADMLSSSGLNAEICRELLKKSGETKVLSDASRRFHGNAAQPKYLCFSIYGTLIFKKKIFFAEFTVRQLLIIILTVVFGN